MLVIKDLKKTYSSGVQALKGVSLELSPGGFGLLGPNGSGKTTLMKIVATLLEPDSGTIEINGVDALARKSHTRQMLGYLPQDFGLYPTLTAWQMLDYLAKLKGVTNKNERHALVDALLDRVNLSAESHMRLEAFSGGMRQRLGIAQAIAGCRRPVEAIDLHRTYRTTTGTFRRRSLEVEAVRGDPVGERGDQLGRRRAHVVADDDHAGRRGLRPQQPGQRRADLADEARVDLLADDAAHVGVLISAWGVQGRQLQMHACARHVSWQAALGDRLVPFLGT